MEEIKIYIHVHLQCSCSHTRNQFFIYHVLYACILFLHYNKESILVDSGHESCKVRNQSLSNSDPCTLWFVTEICTTHYQGLLCYKASEAIFEYIRWSNKLFNDHEPWHICKDPANDNHLNCLLHVTMETLRVCSILLQPLIPDIAAQVLDRLGVSEDDRLFRHCKERRQSHRDQDHHLKVQKNHIMDRIK